MTHPILCLPLKRLLLPARRKPASRTYLSGSANSACPGSAPPPGGCRHSVWLCRYRQSGLELGRSWTRTDLAGAEVLYPGKQERKGTIMLAVEKENTHERRGHWNLEVKTAKREYKRNKRPSQSLGLWIARSSCSACSEFSAWSKVNEQWPRSSFLNWSNTGYHRAQSGISAFGWSGTRGSGGCKLGPLFLLTAPSTCGRTPYTLLTATFFQLMGYCLHKTSPTYLFALQGQGDTITKNLYENFHSTRS